MDRFNDGISQEIDDALIHVRSGVYPLNLQIRFHTVSVAKWSARLESREAEIGNHRELQ
jgi:hypothetical protein